MLEREARLRQPREIHRQRQAALDSNFTEHFRVMLSIIAKCLSARHLIADSGQGWQQVLYVSVSIGMQLSFYMMS